MKIKDFKSLENGMFIKTYNGEKDEKFYLCTNPDFCPADETGTTVVELANGSYSSVSVLLKGQTTNYGAALDIAVDFLLENDIAFDYLEEEPEEFADDYVCCGNNGIYILSTNLHISSIQSTD